MSFKTTYALFVVLLLSLGALGLTQYLKKPQGKGGDFLLPSFHERVDPAKTDNVDTVEIQRLRPEEPAIVLVRDQHGWKIQEPFKHPVHAESFPVEDLIRQVTQARKEKGDVRNDPTQYGLEPPAAIVTLKQGDREWKVKLGDTSPDNKVIYVLSSEQKGPQAVLRTDLDAVTKPVQEFRSKELLAVSPFNTKSISFKMVDPKDSKKTYELALSSGSASRWEVTKPFQAEADFDGEGEGKERPGVKGLLSAVGAIPGGDYFKEDVADLAPYGLEADHPALLRIEAQYDARSRLGSSPAEKPPVEDTLLIGKKAEPKKDDKEKTERYYARLGSERAVLLVPAKNLESILKVVENPDTLRNRDLLVVDANRVDAVTIKQGKNVLELRKRKDIWKLTVNADPPVDADPLVVRQLLDALTAKRQVKGFPSARSSELGLDKPEAEATTISLWENGLEEAKDDAAPKLKEPDKPKARLTFGKEDKGSLFVQRQVGDEKTVLELPAALAVWGTRGKLGYLEHRLPSFVAGSETRLALARPDGAYDLEKAKDKDSRGNPVWTIKTPKEQAGRQADTETVNKALATLRELHPNEWVAEKPTDKELDEFGLKSPVVTATVTLPKDEKTAEERVYQFGKKTKDGASLYARLGGKGPETDRVFTVRPEVLAALERELRDHTLFHFDTNKVTQLKFLGWKSLFMGNTATLVLKRGADKTWTVSEAPFTDFKDRLDGLQAEIFLSELATLGVESFVKGGPKPEYELDKDKRSLQIEVTLEGVKDPITLTVGKLEAGKGYYGQTSLLGDQVVLLPIKFVEKLLKEGVNVFAKKSS